MNDLLSSFQIVWIFLLIFISRLCGFVDDAGGLSMNDFIVASKMDEIKVSDLQPRVRVWA